MSPPLDPSDEHRRAELVGSILSLAKEWNRVFEMGPSAPRPALDYLRTRSRDLQATAIRLELGGLARHLANTSSASEPPLDVAKVRSALQDLREITQQVMDELGPQARAMIDAHDSAPSVAAGGGSSGGVEPPPYLTAYRSAAPSSPAEEPRAPSPARLDVAPLAPLALPRSSVPVEPTLASARDAPHEIAPTSAGVFKRVTTPLPVRPESGAAPNVRVRTMFGLRAFGKTKKKTEPPAAAPDSSLLGLAPKRRASTPPPLLSSSLPPLPQPDPPSPRGAPVERPSREPARRRSVPTPREAEAYRKAVVRTPHERRKAPSLALWLAGFAVLGLTMIAIVVVILVRRSPSDEPAESAGTAAPATGAPAGSQAATPTGSAALPRSRLLSDDEQFRSLLGQMHGRGGKESPELRALLDEQAAVQAQLLSAGKCEGARCLEFEQAKALLVDGPAKPIKRRRPPSGVPPVWMSGLRLPEGLPLEDDPLVRRYFQQYAENRVGRETLQSMLFRCGAYRDLIRATFVRYDVPEAVMALVLVESGCEPMARSPVGALGLFQLMPDTGRGYGLRVQENVLDERISPTKSTEAGVRFLSDLYAKLGSWDLAFAAYNMGPFGLLARVQRAGGDVGFWDLVDADLLPDETAQYVPRIQALALILSNLQRLRFAGLQMRAPEDTSELEVPSGTRLGLIARAASTSLDLVRRLNRDILGDRVPAVPSGRFVVQVPASVVEQARESLGDLVRSRNEEDLCVPSSFDWGRSRFTPEMAEACKKKLADLDPEPGSAAPP